MQTKLKLSQRCPACGAGSLSNVKLLHSYVRCSSCGVEFRRNVLASIFSHTVLGINFLAILWFTFFDFNVWALAVCGLVWVADVVISFCLPIHRISSER
jgi:uncharacterized protein (DUF983 family)